MSIKTVILRDKKRKYNVLPFNGDPDEARTHDLQRDRLAF